MAAGAGTAILGWVQRLRRGCITGLTGTFRCVSAHVRRPAVSAALRGALHTNTVPRTSAFLEKGLVLSSLSLLAVGAYRHAVVYASSKVEDVKERADYIYGSGETEKLYEFLRQYQDSNDAEILWRLSRASRDLAQLNKTTPDAKKRLVYEARDYAKKALEINESCWAAHKWYAICLSDVGDYEGMKVKIGNAYIIRDHFQRAIELNPKDATTIHLIGIWCYTFADLPWYQKKIASALFATPPSSTFDEALKHFEMAEEGCYCYTMSPPEDQSLRHTSASFWPASLKAAHQPRTLWKLNIDPNFYSKNLLYLGKTFLKLKNNEPASVWLHKAKDYPVRTEEDKEVYKEATDLLKSLGVKV